MAVKNMSSYPSNAVFVLPLYTSNDKVPTSIDTWRDFKRIAYNSHKGLNFEAWEKETSHILTYKGKIASPGMRSRISGQEPYFVAHKSFLPTYNVLYWSMIGDKISHIDSMKDTHDFYVLPGCFLVNTPSDGLGEAWLTRRDSSSNSYKNLCKAMQPFFRKLRSTGEDSYLI